MATRTVTTCDRCKEDKALRTFITCRNDAGDDVPEAELCAECTRELLDWLQALTCKGCDSSLSRCAAARLAGKVKCCPDCSHRFPDAPANVQP